ncbi:2-amino-4-hydroxy-6-hydroxymethyldihydropteridine diphosphokinase [Umboniibacter marinipuniceus]|uniref:2-amino-4-hydroxy-6-hydroxymethyldihydropteridine pyrophosphokinase n=1 Tax=Umboniibacter marinipuniceus TaxID=569599 RepID=A0A3M0ACB5_9GAMM|nr:2-amino-4-hydroxy-6-hydroxymethyldihydropteridine diphosphokinase [Umboniibacter marinipuniceus]RMA80085.1 2-amino-4-hydroxy-6-hydroxymethyldihydropteridine diphosphokinase [Umboniibacter marinipuniceus]
MQAFISFGSNLGDQVAIVESAINTLRATSAVTVVSVSPWYRSKAVGPGEQGDYLNGVIELATKLSAVDLLDFLQTLELNHGRERLIRWGSRTLDLDILYFDNQKIETDRLTIPHPRCTERSFVMRPWADVAADLTLDDKKVADIAAELTDDQLCLWQDNPID